MPPRREAPFGGLSLAPKAPSLNRGRIRETVGVLSDELLGKIDRGLILHLELEDYV